MDTAVMQSGGCGRPTGQGLLQAFAARSQVSFRPLMAVSPHFVMGNWAAQPFLGTLDFSQALALASDGDRRWTAVDVFEAPEPGLLMEMADDESVATDPAEHTSGSEALLRLLPGTSKVIGNVRRAALRILSGSGHALLSGEAGTGKATLADHLLEQGATAFTVVDIAIHADWDERLIYALRDRRHVALRHVSSLPEAQVSSLSQMLQRATRRGLRVLMTATPCLPLQLNELVALVEHRLWLPPLRDRIEDIPAIVSTTRPRRAPERLDTDTLRWLWSQQWPGNVRELMAAMRSRRPAASSRYSRSLRIPTSVRRVPLAQDVQKHALKQTLDRCEGNRSRAAVMLGVSRATLYRKIDQYDLHR